MSGLRTRLPPCWHHRRVHCSGRPNQTHTSPELPLRSFRLRGTAHGVAPSHQFVLPLGQHKFFVCGQGTAFVTADQLSPVRFVRILRIVRAAFQTGRNRLAFVFVQRNQPCCRQCHHPLTKKKMPHIGGIEIIWIIFRNRQHLPDTSPCNGHIPARCRSHLRQCIASMLRCR